MRKAFTLFAIGAGVFGLASFLFASSPFDIEFPVPELDGCADRAACKAYCDDFSHKDACIAFAKKHGFASEEEEKQVKSLPPVGPGGCAGAIECRAYCDDPSHVEECVAFGREHGLTSREEAQQARRFVEQAGPGGCRGQEVCRQYCSEEAHHEECISFGERQGFISKEGATRARKLAGQPGPGGCRGEACRQYCENPEHLDECLAFGREHGFISEEEAARVKKLGLGEGPGGCRGREACRQHCEDPTHQGECIDFAEEHGFMSKEDATRARKFAGKTGPGGCRGEECRRFCERPENTEACIQYARENGLMPQAEAERALKFVRAARDGGPGGCRGEACRAYCENPEHQDECFEFAKRNGLMRKEDEQHFEAGKKIRETMLASGGPGGCKSDEECRQYCVEPSHTEECIAFAAAHGGVPQEDARRMLEEFTRQRAVHKGEFRPPEHMRRFEEEARRRFEEFRRLEEEFRGGQQWQGHVPQGFPASLGRPGPGGFSGPGGCTSPAECIKYCFEHQQECKQFMPQGSRQTPAFPQPFPVPPQEGIGPSVGAFPGQGFPFPQGPPAGAGREFEMCVKEVMGDIAPQDFIEHPEEFARKKQEAVARCQERFKDKFPGGFPFQPGQPPLQDPFPFQPRQGMVPPGGSSGFPPPLERFPEVEQCVKEMVGPETQELMRTDPAAFSQRYVEAFRLCSQKLGVQPLPPPQDGQFVPPALPLPPPTSSPSGGVHNRSFLGNVLRALGNFLDF